MGKQEEGAMARFLLGMAVVVLLAFTVVQQVSGDTESPLLKEYTERIAKENAIDVALTAKALKDLNVAKNASQQSLLKVEQAKAAEEMARSELFDAEGSLKACQDQNVESKAHAKTKAIVQKISAMLEEIENPALTESQRKLVVADLQPLVESDPRLSNVVDVQTLVQSGSPSTSAIAQLIAKVLKILDDEASEAAAKCSHIISLIETPTAGLRAKLMEKIRTHKDALGARISQKSKIDQLTVVYNDLRLKERANRARRQKDLEKIQVANSDPSADVTGTLIKHLKQERERSSMDRRVLHARAADADTKRWTKLQNLNEAIADENEKEAELQRAKAAVHAKTRTCTDMKESARQQQALLEEMMRLTLGMNGEQTTDIQMQTRTTPVTHQDDMLDDDSVEKAEARIEHDLMAISFLQLGEGKVRTHDEAGQIQRYLQQLLSMSKNDTQI